MCIILNQLRDRVKHNGAVLETDTSNDINLMFFEPPLDLRTATDVEAVVRFSVSVSCVVGSMSGLYLNTNDNIVIDNRDDIRSTEIHDPARNAHLKESVVAEGLTDVSGMDLGGACHCLDEARFVTLAVIVKDLTTVVIIGPDAAVHPAALRIFGVVEL